MKTFLTVGLSLLLPIGILVSKASAAPAKPGYHVAATWKLDGPGGWDYLSMDSKAHRIYIARGTRVQVVDSNTGALVGEIPNVDGAHGVALDSANHRAYATSGRNNSVIVFDTDTLKQLGNPIPVGQKPDAILFEPNTKTVWAFDAGSNAVSIINPITAKVTNTVDLGGNPEFGVSDGAGHVWVNIENTSETVELNAADGKILNRTALTPGDGPTGLAIDVKNGHLFSGCANKTMVVLDASTGKQISTLAVGDGIDATAFDIQRGLAFSSNGRDGTVSVVGMDGDHLAVLNTIPTHKGARTMTLDQETGALFFVAADYEAPAAGQAGRRPRMVPGSAVVLKLEPDAVQ